MSSATRPCCGWRCPTASCPAAQLRALAKIAREYDQPNRALFNDAQARQEALGAVPLPGGGTVNTHLTVGFGHFTTRQNLQFNWIPLDPNRPT
jgi:sulfite reductase (NADPH) hemoprotein beta-component